MFNYKKIIFFFFALIIQLYTIAQTTGTAVKPEKQEFMRSEGKIYVVMAIVITILTGFLLYVYRLDLKIRKLEKSDKL